MTYRHEPHQIADKPVGGFTVCKRCGLVYLRNDLTEWHIAMGCQAAEHPDAQRVRSALVRRHQERRR